MERQASSGRFLFFDRYCFVWLRSGHDVTHQYELRLFGHYGYIRNVASRRCHRLYLLLGMRGRRGNSFGSRRQVWPQALDLRLPGYVKPR